MLSIDRLLEDFGLSISDREQACRTFRTAFASQVTVDRGVKHALGQLFREERGRLYALLGADPAIADETWQGIAATMMRRSRQTRRTIAQLSAAEHEGLLSRTIRTIVPSLVHMNVNRLLRRPRSEHELVLYDLLARHYAQQRARALTARAVPG